MTNRRRITSWSLSSSIAVVAVGLAVLILADGRALPVHESFSLTIRELEQMTSSLPIEIQHDIANRPRYFLDLLEEVLLQPRDLLILVDKEHALAPDYVPPDLTTLSSHAVTVARPDLSVRESILPDLLLMATASRSEGVELVFSSGYRSFEYQQEVYERNVRWLGEEAANRESAKAGRSEHQLGTTIDFGSISDEFAQTDAGRWLKAHAWRYGFSLSYPEGWEEVTGYRHEIWHYRYLTRPATLVSREFFLSVPQFLLEFIDEHSDQLYGALGA